MDIFSEPIVPEVSCQDVKSELDQKKPVILLDVRTPGEFARGRIAGSINIPIDRIECDIEQTVPDKSATIYVYCLSGSRSVHAVHALIKLGYTQVFNVKQGLLAWRAYYFPVVS